jgi:hypothetical protein
VTALPVRTRPGLPSDLDAVTELAVALWPDAPEEEHREHAAAILAGTPPSTLPLVLLVAVAEDGGDVVVVDRCVHFRKSLV